MKKIITILMTVCMLFTSVTFCQLSASAKMSVPKSKIKSVSIIDTTTLKIKWNKVKSISRYELYYKVLGGAYKKLGTFSNNTTSYTHKKLKTNKKYFYKIRTYKVVNGKKYYSKFSNPVGKKTTDYLMQITKPYLTNYYSECINGESMMMGGDNYTNGFYFYWYDSYAIFNLKSKYRKISFTYGSLDGDSDDATLYILSDDDCIKTLSIKGGSLPKNITIDIENASKLEFRLDDSTSSSPHIGIANIRVFK